MKFFTKFSDFINHLSQLKLHDHVEILAGPYQGYYGAIVCVQGANQLFTVEIVEPSGYTLDMRDYTKEQLRLAK